MGRREVVDRVSRRLHLAKSNTGLSWSEIAQAVGEDDTKTRQKIINAAAGTALSPTIEAPLCAWIAGVLGPDQSV